MIEAPYTGASVWITGLRLGGGFVGRRPALAGRAAVTLPSATANGWPRIPPRSSGGPNLAPAAP